MRQLLSIVVSIALAFSVTATPALASDVPQETTPDYKVAFYHFDCYHMQDENGLRSGYGYEMMQGVAKHMQCTFSYVGYDKSAEECVEMLRRGELDIYTAARKTPEREKEFVFSKHPAITSSTCMNVKVGNTKIVSGDYSTYNGMKIGLLARHTYNDSFIAWAKDKGFKCKIVYYDTPTELSNALVEGEVDALVNSYIRTPEDEVTIENFGDTPYYIMALPKNKVLIDSIDKAIDAMSVETPNWRVDLFNKYYGSQALNTSLTTEEEKLLSKLQKDQTTVNVLMNPEAAPYSYFENGEPAGISVEICQATAQKLGLNCAFVPVSSKAEYLEKVAAGAADVVLDYNDQYQVEGDARYKATNSYLESAVSLLRMRGSSGKVESVAVLDDRSSFKDVVTANWPDSQVFVVQNASDVVSTLTSGQTDGAVLLAYSAQKIAREDVQNRLRVEIVPDTSLALAMGVNANLDYSFYGLWEKTLSDVSAKVAGEAVQNYAEINTAPTAVAYLFDHPTVFYGLLIASLLFLFVVLLYALSMRSRRKLQQTSEELAVALKEAKDANEAKQNFFSKMSHDIRTPLNVVLGMTQIAAQCKDDQVKLNHALENISSEGNYLLTLINSILDVNQLEYGHVELQKAAFDPCESATNSVEMLRPLAQKREQELTLVCKGEGHIVIGDETRFGQIMINIVSNAIKYTDMGGAIDVTLECLDDNRCRFVCKDNGIGMSEEFVSHITEDYVRAEDSRVSKAQGTGLGMSVVKGFTELMGGTLAIESTLGEGSTFIIEIPFEEVSTEEREAYLKAREEKQREMDSFAGKKVLLAEDNALNAEVACELMKTIGLRVDWAHDGADALKRFEESENGEYLAVFMDMQMPVMDGVTATKAIRACDRSDAHIPIFAMTANTFASDKRACQDAGMDGYIAKPVETERIAEALRDISG